MKPSSSPTSRISFFCKAATLAVTASFIPFTVHAGDSNTHGKDVRAWVDLQKAQKPKGDERISGEQAQLIWDRHMKTFGKDVPDTLRDGGDISSGSR